MTDTAILGANPPYPIFTIDTSAWVLRDGHAAVADRLDRAGHSGWVTLTPPVCLEIGFTARGPREWDLVQHDMAEFTVLPMSHGTHEIAREIQRRLWHGGLVRAAGTTDVIVAALAIEHAATVLHYDRDFAHIAQVYPWFSHEWVAPPGSLGRG